MDMSIIKRREGEDEEEEKCRRLEPLLFFIIHICSLVEMSKGWRGTGKVAKKKEIADREKKNGV